jgi:hypothetical protein
VNRKPKPRQRKDRHKARAAAEERAAAARRSRQPLWGCSEIAAYLFGRANDETERKTYYLAGRRGKAKDFPITHVGGMLTASPDRIDEYLAEDHGQENAA